MRCNTPASLSVYSDYQESASQATFGQPDGPKWRRLFRTWMSIYEILSSKTPRVVSEDDLLYYKQERIRTIEVVLLITLCFVNIATQGSRFSLNFVFYPYLESDLGLTETQYGVLSGMGFSFVMVGCMIPWGFAADNPMIGRRNVILCGLLIQGLFCSLQGAAWDFWSLLIIRFGLAAGQSAIQAPCLAVLARFYQNSGGLATANALFTMGIYLGGGLASLGGELAYVYGWQTSFGVFGILCFIGCLATFLMVPDDRMDMRKDEELRARSPRPSLTDRGTFRYFLAWFTSPAPGLLTSAGCLRFMAGFCLTSFLPVYFQRNVAKDPSSIANISLWYGIITTVSGCISVLSGGYLSDSLLKYGMLNAPALVSAVGSLAAVPLTLLMFFAPVHESVVLLFLFLSYLATWLWMGPSTSIAQVPFLALVRPRATVMGNRRKDHTVTPGAAGRAGAAAQAPPRDRPRHLPRDMHPLRHPRPYHRGRHARLLWLFAPQRPGPDAGSQLLLGRRPAPRPCVPASGRFAAVPAAFRCAPAALKFLPRRLTAAAGSGRVLSAAGVSVWRARRLPGGAGPAAGGAVHRDARLRPAGRVPEGRVILFPRTPSAANGRRRRRGADAAPAAPSCASLNRAACAHGLPPGRLRIRAREGLKSGDAGIRVFGSGGGRWPGCGLLD